MGGAPCRVAIPCELCGALDLNEAGKSWRAGSLTASCLGVIEFAPTRRLRSCRQQALAPTRPQAMPFGRPGCGPFLHACTPGIEHRCLATETRPNIRVVRSSLGGR